MVNIKYPSSASFTSRCLTNGFQNNNYNRNGKWKWLKRHVMCFISLSVSILLLTFSICFSTNAIHLRSLSRNTVCLYTYKTDWLLQYIRIWSLIEASCHKTCRLTAKASHEHKGIVHRGKTSPKRWEKWETNSRRSFRAVQVFTIHFSHVIFKFKFIYCYSIYWY